MSEQDGKEPLFVFRHKDDAWNFDSSRDIYGDIYSMDDYLYTVIDREGQKHPLSREAYQLFANPDIQYVLVDVHMNQSRWLLVDTWKKNGAEGREIASYPGIEIRAATQHAKRLNTATVWPTMEEFIERHHQIMGEIKKYKEENEHGTDPSL